MVISVHVTAVITEGQTELIMIVKKRQSDQCIPRKNVINCRLEDETWLHINIY